MCKDSKNGDRKLWPLIVSAKLTPIPKQNKVKWFKWQRYLDR